MTESCPSCGQLLPFDGARAWVDLDNNVVVVDGTRVRLTPRQCELVASLLDTAPRTVTRGHLMDLLYGQRLDEPLEKIIDVMICRIRKNLAGTALQIEAVRGRGLRITLNRRV